MNYNAIVAKEDKESFEKVRCLTFKVFGTEIEYARCKEYVFDYDSKELPYCLYIYQNRFITEEIENVYFIYRAWIKGGFDYDKEDDSQYIIYKGYFNTINTHFDIEFVNTEPVLYLSYFAKSVMLLNEIAQRKERYRG